MNRKKVLKFFIWIIVILFIVLNLFAFIHAYKFTHFTTRNMAMAKDAKHLSPGEKIKILFCGIDIPRPVNTSRPSEAYETIELQSNKKIECWKIKAEKPKGTVIIFHGYYSQKSSMLDKSQEFLKLGFNTLLVDFMGSGGSEGNQTTVGFKEAEEVRTCYDYLNKQGEKKIYLFGTSMGSVAILKAIRDNDLQPAAIIIECPFGSMYQTTCNRLQISGIPSFPMAGLLNFWGGIQNGFWAFSHVPAEYAKAIRCPVLLLYGERDERVSREEIDEIYANLNCNKELKTYPLAGHKNYWIKYKKQWIQDISNFMIRTNTN